MLSERLRFILGSFLKLEIFGYNHNNGDFVIYHYLRIRFGNQKMNMTNRQFMIPKYVLLQPNLLSQQLSIVKSTNTIDYQQLISLSPYNHDSLHTVYFYLYMVKEYSVFVLKAIVLSRLPCGTCKKSDTGLSFVLVIS